MVSPRSALALSFCLLRLNVLAQLLRVEVGVVLVDLQRHRGMHLLVEQLAQLAQELRRCNEYELPEAARLIAVQENRGNVSGKQFRLMLGGGLVRFIPARLRSSADVMSALRRGTLAQLIGLRFHRAQPYSSVDHVVDFFQRRTTLLFRENPCAACVCCDDPCGLHSNLFNSLGKSAILGAPEMFRGCGEKDLRVWSCSHSAPPAS